MWLAGVIANTDMIKAALCILSSATPTQVAQESTDQLLDAARSKLDGKVSATGDLPSTQLPKEALDLCEASTFVQGGSALSQSLATYIAYHHYCPRHCRSRWRCSSCVWDLLELRDYHRQHKCHLVCRALLLPLRPPLEVNAHTRGSRTSHLHDGSVLLASRPSHTASHWQLQGTGGGGSQRGTRSQANGISASPASPTRSRGTRGALCPRNGVYT